MNTIPIVVASLVSGALAYLGSGRRKNHTNITWTVKRLKAVLDEFNIDYSNWGKTSDTNTVESLVEWLNNGEVRLVIIGNRLELHINVLVVTIYCHHSGDDLILREHRYKKEIGIFAKRPWDGSIGEKFSANRETVGEAGVRAIREELKIKAVEQSELVIEEVEILTAQPDFHPPLPHVYNRHHVTWNMPPRHYQSHYETEDSQGRPIVFKWEKRNGRRR